MSERFLTKLCNELNQKYGGDHGVYREYYPIGYYPSFYDTTKEFKETEHYFYVVIPDPNDEDKCDAVFMTKKEWIKRILEFYKPVTDKEESFLYMLKVGLF